MQVGMQMEILPPGVQHRQESDGRAQTLGSAAMVSNVSDAARNRMP